MILQSKKRSSVLSKNEFVLFVLNHHDRISFPINFPNFFFCDHFLLIKRATVLISRANLAFLNGSQSFFFQAKMDTSKT